MVIHLNNKALAPMDDKNNTKIIRYLDGGAVCGFIVIDSGSGSGSGGGGGGGSRGAADGPSH